MRRGPPIGSKPRRGAWPARRGHGVLPRASPAGGPRSRAPRCASGRLTGRRTPRGSGPRPEGSPVRSGPVRPGSRGWVLRCRSPRPNRGGPFALAPSHPRTGPHCHGLDGPDQPRERTPEPLVRRAPGPERGRGLVARLGVDEEGARRVQRDGHLDRKVAAGVTDGPADHDVQKALEVLEPVRRDKRRDVRRHSSPRPSRPPSDSVRRERRRNTATCRSNCLVRLSMHVRQDIGSANRAIGYQMGYLPPVCAAMRYGDQGSTARCQCCCTGGKRGAGEGLRLSRGYE